MRTQIKSVAERLLDRSGLITWMRSVQPPGRLVLAWHNVVPDGSEQMGECSLHAKRSTFGAQLDALAESFEIVPLGEILRRDPEKSGRPVAAITFDDAYRGAVTVGADELRKRGLPATFFVAPGCLGDRSFWWDELASLTDGEIPHDLRSRALSDWAGDTERIREELGLGASGDGVVPRIARSATVRELDELVQCPGFEIGAHGWSHRTLSRLDPYELEVELTRPLAWLRERFPRVVPWLAYPYGQSDPGIDAAVGSAGYEGALRVDGGYLPRPGPISERDSLALPRLNVSAGMSVEGLLLRTVPVPTS